jgi:hypothetical protein
MGAEKQSPKTKVCRGCGRRRPLERFSVTSRGRGYHNSECKACVAARVRAWEAKNPERAKAYHRDYMRAWREREARRAKG